MLHPKPALFIILSRKLEMPKTCKESFCKVFGLSKKFEVNVLPSKSYAMKYCLCCRLLLKDNPNVKDINVSEMSVRFEKYMAKSIHFI